MREFIDAGILANTVSMIASNREGAIWISDHDEEARFYESRCAHRKATVIPAPNQAHLVMTSLNERGLKGVIATVPPSTSELPENEFSLSSGDVTSLLVFSPSCPRILEELAGRSWYEAAESFTSGFIQMAQRIACKLGKIRQSIGVERGDRKPTLNLLRDTIDWSSLDLVRPMGYPDISRDTWEQAIASGTSTLCYGEDMLVVLAASLLDFRPRGIQPHRELMPDELLTVLWAGFHIEELELDQMYWSLRAWQLSNRFPLLRDWRKREPFELLLDQRYWEADLERYLSRDKGHQMAVFKIDLDNFKGVNDQIGHTGGDEAIKLYSEIIKNEIGAVAEVYRRGGDEVIAFSPSIPAEEARWRAEAIRAAIEKRFKEWSTEKRIEQAPTASIGLVICASGHSKELVIAEADRTQKQAKSEGKNRVVEALLQEPS